MAKGLFRSEYTKNVITLFSGTTISQAISFGISPILSRIYSPSEFGIYGIFTSIIGLICLFSGARYEGAILIPKEEDEAANVFALALFFNFMTSILSFFTILILSFILPGSYTDSELFKWFYLLPLFILFIGSMQSITSWYNRKKAYKKMVHYRISNSFINNGSALAFGFSKLSANGLILSYLLAHILAIGVYFNYLLTDFKQFSRVVSKERMIAVAKKYKRFPLTNSFQTLSEAMQINGIIYFVSYFFDKIITGIYTFAIRILMVPMNFAGAAMAQVFYQQATNVYNTSAELRPLVKSTLLKSLIIAIPALIILLFWGSPLFAFIFGEQWREAGVYASILSPWILLDFVRAPLSQVPIIVGKQKRLLTLSVLSNIIVVSVMFYFGYIMPDLKKGLLLLSIIQSLYCISIIGWIYYISSKPTPNHINSN